MEVYQISPSTKHPDQAPRIPHQAPAPCYTIRMRCIVELIGDDRNGRKMIAWGRRVGCEDAGHRMDYELRKLVTRLLVDDQIPAQRNFLLELADNPAGLRAIVPA